MAEFFDLFGELRDDTPQGRGRPEHEPTDENRFKIMILQCMEKTQAQIAKTLGISVPTLKAHYSSILTNKKLARDREFVARAARLWQQGADGSTSAFKEYDRIVEAALLKGETDKVRAVTKGATPYQPKAEKEIAKAAAAASNSDWADLVPEGKTIQ